MGLFWSKMIIFWAKKPIFASKMGNNLIFLTKKARFCDEECGARFPGARFPVLNDSVPYPMTQTPPPHKSKSNTIQLNQKKLQDFDQETKKYEQDLEKVNSLAKKTSDQLLKIQQQCSNEVSHKRTLERQLEMAVSEIRKAEEKHGKLRFGS